MRFQDKLNNIIKKNNSLLCVGLDSELEKIPQHLKSDKNPQFNFNKAIIDATFDLVCAYKPNAAFYEAEGVQGIHQLKQTFNYIKEKFPEIPVILDAKRADIGNTNEGYVKFAFDYLSADAITLHPYLGKESLKPFLDRDEKGIFILCRTSNPGAGEFQDLLVTPNPPGRNSLQDKPSGSPRGEAGHLPGVAKRLLEGEDRGEKSKPRLLYQIIAEHVAKEWNYNGNCGLVVGATYPTELEIVRRIVGDLPILIPGIGSQGADIEKTVKAGIDSQNQNVIINSSRGIIFASIGLDFAQKAREEAEKLRKQINYYRISTL